MSQKQRVFDSHVGGQWLTPLLPNEPRVVNAQVQAKLTERYLLRRLTELAAFFLALRHLVDPVLEQKRPLKLGKVYPIGQCLEITQAVQRWLPDAGTAATGFSDTALAGAQAYQAFRKAGGSIRQVWGDLRGEFFQNAFQLGTLYVDVANDTVMPTKPKVEILPFDESSLIPIADFKHFRRIAERYWQARIFPNHVIPALAPTCPLIHVSPDGKVQLAEATRYMVAMAQASAFRSSEEVLCDMPVPDDILAHVQRHLAGTQWALAHSAEAGRAAALRACRDQRAKRWHLSRRQADAHLQAVIAVNQRLLHVLPSRKQRVSQRWTVDVGGVLPYALPPVNASLEQRLDEEIVRLKQRLAICQTARIAYAQALNDELLQHRDGA